MENDFKLEENINWDIFKTLEPINKAWSTHNKLKNSPAPTKNELLVMAKKIKTLSWRALFIVAYLTAGRISELVRTDYLYKTKYAVNPKTGKVKRNEHGSPIQETKVKIPIKFPGLKKTDFSITYKEGRKLLIISIPNRKNPKVKRKNLPIPYDKEGEFIQMLDEYLDMFKDDDVVFPFNRRGAEEIFKKQLKINPHTIRSYRAIRLVVDYNFNEYKLIQYMGWSNGLPATKYVRQNMKDIVGGDY